MTTEQRDLARHALGLPNASRKSYRNYFCTDPDHPEWMALVAEGLAMMNKRPAGICSGNVFFHLTRRGALLALDRGERLCGEDFPVQADEEVSVLRSLSDGYATATCHLVAAAGCAGAGLRRLLHQMAKRRTIEPVRASHFGLVYWWKITPIGLQALTAEPPTCDAVDGCMVAVADARADTPALSDAATPEPTP